VPLWRNGDQTSGSTVHSNDLIQTQGAPTYDSVVTTAFPDCQPAPSNTTPKCYQSTDGAMPTSNFKKGAPTYATGVAALNPATVKANLEAASGACIYTGPTRIKFVGSQMQVWSPQTQASDNPDQNCGGGVAPNILSTITGTLTGLLGGTLLSAIPLDQLVSVVPLASTPTPVPIPSAIYVRDNDGTLARPGVAASPPAPTGLFCLLGKTLGLYGTLDPDVTAIAGDALTNLSNLLAGCGKGKLYVDGAFNGKTTIGTDGDITIMSDLYYSNSSGTSSAGSDHDGTNSLGLVSTNGAVQVWTPLQCSLALSTCLSLNPNNVTPLKILGADIHVEAAIMSLRHTFGVSLPLLSRPPSSACSVRRCWGATYRTSTSTVRSRSTTGAHWVRTC
jgi:hypothetical protein